MDGNDESIYRPAVGDGEAASAADPSAEAVVQEVLLTGLQPLDNRRMRRCFARLERLARSRKITKTYTRTNLVPGAPRDARGYLLEGIPSMTIRSGPIFRLLKEMRPDFPFNVVQLNKLKSHRQ